MTQEEKARAYDETLKIAQCWLNSPQIIQECNYTIEDAIQNIFPQLKESKDERIIKFLKHAATLDAADELFQEYGVKHTQVIAYLEKQKEANKAIEAVDRIDKYIDEHLANAHDMKDSNSEKKYYRGWDDALGKMAGILQDVYSEEKQKPVESISQLTVQGKGIYKICPRCKERMIRDDSKVYTSMPPQYGYKCPKCGEMEFDTVMYDSPVDDKQKEQKPLKVGENAYFDPNTETWFTRKEMKTDWNEDERIRRTLVEYFGPNAQLDLVRGVPIQKIRDWLEKQKENQYFVGYAKGYSDGQLNPITKLMNL